MDEMILARKWQGVYFYKIAVSSAEQREKLKKLVIF